MQNLKTFQLPYDVQFESVGRCQRARRRLQLVVGIADAAQLRCECNRVRRSPWRLSHNPHSVYNATFSFNNPDALSLTLSIYQRSFLDTDGLYGTLG